MRGLPIVAIVGRPNVGKSTLFNRLVGRRRALVTDEPGVTRDRLYGTVRARGVEFALVDTGGISADSEAPLARGIERQARAAIDESALVVFVVDGRAGRSPLDEEVAAFLRRRGKPVIVAVNKSEFRYAEGAAEAEFSVFGFGRPLPISAEHGSGIDDLLDRIASEFQGMGDRGEGKGGASTGVRIAIVGRPNVGKSSIVNRLLGTDRVLVSDVPGTTRDSVDSVLEKDGTIFVLVDTAGIRKRAKWSRSAERLAVVAAERAIDRAEVVVFVLDATEPLTSQDTHIAALVERAARPFVIVVNKWDLASDREEKVKTWEREIRTRLRFAGAAPVLFTSAKSGQRIARILDAAAEVHGAAGRRVPTPELNRWLARQAERERSNPAGGKSIRLFYATQTGIHPPRFVLFCNDARRVHFSLRRRLENDLRESFQFGPAPIRLSFRSRRERART
jgi:GTP-binding protein